MTTHDRYKAVLDYFAHAMPDPKSELHFNNPFEVLCAVILSAQCTDKRVNMVTPDLFQAFPTPEAMADADVNDILHFIKSVSYPNSKAAHLKAMAQMLVDKFHSNVPSTLEELTQLPGVGRKTANVVMGVVFGKPAIAVDTHVFRVANRLGLADAKTPLEVEKTLTRHIPENLQYKAHHWLLMHGRYVCKAQRPDCLNCHLSHLCKHYSSK